MVTRTLILFASWVSALRLDDILLHLRASGSTWNVNMSREDLGNQKMEAVWGWCMPLLYGCPLPPSSLSLYYIYVDHQNKRVEKCGITSVINIYNIYVWYKLYVQYFISFYAEEVDGKTLLNLSVWMIEQLLPAMKLRVKLLKLIEQLKGDIKERWGTLPNWKFAFHLWNSRCTNYIVIFQLAWTLQCASC